MNLRWGYANPNRAFFQFRLRQDKVGWAGKKNGELLALMAGDGFEVLLTVDQNLRYQQNLAASGVAVVVMVAPTNRFKDLKPLVPSVVTALGGIKPGDVVEVDS